MPFSRRQFSAAAKTASLIQSKTRMCFYPTLRMEIKAVIRAQRTCELKANRIIKQ